MKEIINTSYNNGILKERQKEKDEAIRMKQYHIDSNIGKKIVYCSNEWEDPTFAKITGITTICNGNTTMFLAHDVINNQEVMIHLNSFYVADRKIVEALLKLNPFERWNMSVGKMYSDTTSYVWSKHYEPFSKISEPKEIMNVLESLNFFD